MLKSFIDALMGAEANALCDALQVRAAMIGSTPVLVTRPGTGTPRRDHAGGHPKLRVGSCFPTGCWSGAGGPGGR